MLLAFLFTKLKKKKKQIEEYAKKNVRVSVLGQTHDLKQQLVDKFPLVLDN